MARTTLRLVTIIAEPLLEKRIIEDLRTLGARGWSITDGRGEGSRGMRAGEIPGTNVRIETLVAPDAADRIVDHIARSYFDHFAVVAWVAGVEVVRGDKYV